jgi:signal transduction histidine kinase
VVDAEQPLHQVIRENAAQIVDRFVAEVENHDLPSRSMSREEIIDHLHGYLREMAQAIESGEREPLTESSTARQHGEQRWYAGYDLRSVVREFHLIRNVIFQVVERLGVRPSVREFESLSQFLNVGIGDSVLEFTEKSEQQIEAALAQAKAATRAREEVLAIVSHDLKNPLNVVYVNVHLLLQELEANDLNVKRSRIRKRLEGIRRASERMNQLIGDMLDLARLAAGEVGLRLESTNCRQLLQEAGDLTSTLAEQRAIKIVTEVGPELPVRCDRDRILQVLQNLLDNAIKFSPVGGIVTLRSRCDAESCTFEVTDTGTGIPEEHLPLLFQNYWQAPATAALGNGLGLSIAKSIVDLHGGRIWVESLVGRGSTFFFKLPREPQRPPTA